MTGDADQLDSPGLSPGDLEQLAAEFQLGKVHRVSYLAAGMMNRNWRLDCHSGTVALKQVVDVPVRKLRRSLDVASALARQGLPVCAPRATASGDVLADVGGGTYCVVPWAAGIHREGATLRVREAEWLGRLLGEIHQALALPGTGLEPLVETPRAKVTAPARALAEADRYLSVIAGLPTRSDFDAATAALLEQRRKLLAEYADYRPRTEMPRGPVGWTHGDFQPLNLLWAGQQVVAVLDWDRLGVRPYAEEVVRTAQVQFGTEAGELDLPRVAAFVSGYRALVPVDEESLADAADRLWWKRMTDYWQLQWHYDKGDHGPDGLWLSGEHRLAWWTHEKGTVRGAFTGQAPPEPAAH